MTTRKNIFPTSFARYVETRWGNLVAGPDAERPPKPPSLALRQALEVSYLSSMAVDEGRPVTFHLCCCPHGVEPVSQRADPGSFEVLAFEQLRPFNVEEIRKLGVATDPDASAIWATWNAEGAMDIAGLLRFRGHWAASRRVQSADSGALPEALSIRALGPGRLQVFEANYFLGELRSGSIIEPSSVSLFDVLGAYDSARAGLDELGNAIERPQYEYVKEWHEYEFLAWFNTLFAVVNAVQDHQHGGAVVILPSRDLDPNLLRVKYAFSPKVQPLRSALVEHLNRRHEWGDTYALRYELTASDVTGPVPSKQTLTRRLKKSSEQNYVAMQRVIEAAKFVSSLSGADGAILLTRTFDIIGFGAEIRAEVPEGTRIREVEDALGGDTRECNGDTRECNVEQFGMRHRSALKLCAACPDALVVVISQDGDASLVWTKNGDVHIKRNLNTTNANMVLA